MPNTKSAKKELRKNAKRKAYNREIKDNVKSLMKQSKKAIIAKDSSARDLVPQTLKALDKAVQKGVLKENTADRKKSKIHKLFNKEMSEEKKK
jgi:small subunit ribosomal protein S20